MAPRAVPAPERPPVENCRIMPGQCSTSSAFSRANRAGSAVGRPSSSRTWQCTIAAPASNAAWVLSTCSAIEIGTAGLSLLVGSDPVMATQMMHGLMRRTLPGFRFPR